MTGLIRLTDVDFSIFFPLLRKRAKLSLIDRYRNDDFGIAGDSDEKASRSGGSSLDRNAGRALASFDSHKVHNDAVRNVRVNVDLKTTWRGFFGNCEDQKTGLPLCDRRRL